MVRQGKGDGGVLSSTGIDDCLPLYALSLIFPYRSYIGTVATGGWIGNSPEKSKNFRGDRFDPGEGVIV